MAGISAPFSTVQEADAAYYGDGGGGDGDGDGGDGGGGDGDGDGGGDGATWGKLQEGSSLGSGWVLAYQNQQNGGRRRWFAIRMKAESLQALKSNGEPQTAGENTKLSELPHYSNEDDARAAYQAWAEENGGEENDDSDDSDDSDEWGNWTKVSEEKPWHIYSRTHQSEDRAQFLATSTLGDGSTVYLGSGGEVVDDPYTFDSADALSKALRAYFQRSENGDIPEGRTPTGDDPGTETVRKEASRVNTSSSTKKMERLVEKMGGQKVVLAGLAVGALAVYQKQKEGGS